MVNLTINHNFLLFQTTIENAFENMNMIVSQISQKNLTIFHIIFYQIIWFLVTSFQA